VAWFASLNNAAHVTAIENNSQQNAALRRIKINQTSTALSFPQTRGVNIDA